MPRRARNARSRRDKCRLRWLYSRSPSFIAAGVIGVQPGRAVESSDDNDTNDDAYLEKRVKYKFYEPPPRRDEACVWLSFSV